MSGKTFDVSVILKLIDNLTKPAQNAARALHGVGQNLGKGLDGVQSRFSRLQSYFDGVTRAAGRMTGSLRDSFASVINKLPAPSLVAFERMRGAFVAGGTKLGYAMAGGIVKALEGSLASAEKSGNLNKYLPLQERLSNAAAHTNTKIDEAKARLLPWLGGSAAMVAIPGRQAAIIEDASSKIAMIAGMDAETRKHFDRQMLTVGRSNVFGFEQSYHAAEMAARLGTYSEAVKKYGDTPEGRVKAADKLVNWVRYVEMASLPGGMDPEKTSENLKYTKNQFGLTDEGAINLLGKNIALSHIAGFMPDYMVRYMVRGGVMASQFGFTPEQTMAIGANWLNKGVAPERAGTNLGYILNYLTTARSEKAAEGFEDLFGKSHKEMFAKVKEDPFGVFTEYVGKIMAASKTAEGYEKLTRVVGVAQLPHLMAALEGFDVKTIPYYNYIKDLDGTGYIHKKSDERKDTLVQQGKLLLNHFNEMMDLVAEPWLPFLKRRMQGTMNMFSGISDAMRGDRDKNGPGAGKYTWTQMIVSGGVAAIAAALGGAALGMLIKQIGIRLGIGVMQAVGSGMLMRAAVAGAYLVRALQIAFRPLTGLFGTLFRGLWGGVTQVGAVGAAIATLGTRALTARMAFTLLRGAIMGLGRIAFWGTAISAAWSLLENWQTVAGHLKTIWADLKKAWSDIFTFGWRSPQAQKSAGQVLGGGLNNADLDAVGWLQSTWIGKALLAAGLDTPVEELRRRRAANGQGFYGLPTGIDAAADLAGVGPAKSARAAQQSGITAPDAKSAHAAQQIVEGGQKAATAMEQAGQQTAGGIKSSGSGIVDALRELEAKIRGAIGAFSGAGPAGAVTRSGSNGALSDAPAPAQ